MMYYRYLFSLILSHWVVGGPQINLYYTDSVSANDNDLQHDCLHTIAFIKLSNISRQMISFCIGEASSKFNIDMNDFSSKFTFAQLAKRNITSQQLYFWSAPIDIVERYQLYLDDQVLTSNDHHMAGEIFYNCTMPRFGSMCQYEFDHYDTNYTSASDMIDGFYSTHEYVPTNFTCYTHLQCDRGPSPACLDWTEICNGHIDCLDDGLDEEHCWQLEMNECKDDEYRCSNGQCIPQSFYQDGEMPSDCVDTSDELPIFLVPHRVCDLAGLSFRCEDMTCTPKPLTSSCIQQREELLLQAMFSIQDSAISNDCWSAFKCIIPISFNSGGICNDFCRADVCVEIIERTCPDMLYIPSVPVVHNDIHFAYQKTDAKILNTGTSWHPYVCYNNSRYDDYFLVGSKVFFQNTTCYRNVHQPISSGDTFSWGRDYLVKLYRLLWSYDLIFNYTSIICNRSNTYQCVNSLKCISIHRLSNGIHDCPQGDDEDQVNSNNIHVFELFNNINAWLEDEFETKLHYARNNISFQNICDGFTELLPITINGQNETDETECELWQCSNIYTRCNQLWNCFDGADEVGCDVSLPLQCSADHHICVSPHTNQFICLPLAKANDGRIDCLGASDEPRLCRSEYVTVNEYNFYCRNQNNLSSCIHSSALCDGHKQCYYTDDEQFCKEIGTLNKYPGICWIPELLLASDVEKFLCKSMRRQEKEPVQYFSLDETSKFIETPLKNTESSALAIPMPHQHESRCHHGLDLRVRLNNKNDSAIRTCLCPPSFYGDTCQYQNQRVSLTIRFRALSDCWQTPFTILISLIDDSDERLIHSYEQITYLSMRDCNIKYNIYLLYSMRPKNLTRRYSIQIDLYEKISLTYRGSLLFLIAFPFLPVHRLAYIVDIPRSSNRVQTCFDRYCVHGKCIKYSNNEENRSFCQCDRGWSGRRCTIPHNCMCSVQSLYIGVAANHRSICVCPPDKFGLRCLIDTVCQKGTESTCQNGGQCVPTDEYMMSKQKFTCICPQGFTGDRCELADNKLVLSFDKNIILSQSIFIHFIEVVENRPSIRATTFRTIPIKQDSVVIQWSQPFHLVFVELFKKNYYLTVVQKSYNRSAIMHKRIDPRDRCQHISEVFNETFIQLHLLRRIKYYHLPCQNYVFNLSCFYDDTHFCLCYDQDQKRLANCFEFNHHMTFDCLGQSECENGGQCFQDAPDCPKRSICVCPPCFYGTRCQFSTSGFGLSLDAILGYHIRPHISIIHQPSIVQISVVLTIIFILAGLINSILSMITFKNKIICEVGCGLYLFGVSVTALFTMIIFGLKFWILLLTQMAVISNRSFLTVQCYSIDFLLRICLSMDQWLSTCVALERAITAKKGTTFNKKKSKRAAKIVIVVLLIVIVGTSIHDPLHRRLIVEENEDHEKRLWCIVTYPSNLQIFNSVMYIFQFFGPFIINLTSALILIKKKSRRQSNIHPDRTSRQLLRRQFQQHRNLFTAPMLLVILALPRLIIGFVSKCMKSANDSWLFLVGYFISFIPSMLTFVIFVLPSEFYKRHFYHSLAPYQNTIQRGLQLTVLRDMY